MTGEEAYNEDVRRKPTYDDGSPRKKWVDLDRFAQEAWNRNPTPRNWGQEWGDAE